LGNAALHAHGVTDAAVHYNTPSKFEVPAESLPAGVKPVYDVFVELEAMRSHFVRNPNEPDAQGAAEAQRLLARMATLCDVN
jgi:alkylation response protein AidB-like acyl-CoA dehydrogenase